MTIRFFVPGEPQPQPRHRIAPGGRRHLPKLEGRRTHPVVRWKQTVTLVGASSIRTPLAGPLAVSVHVVLSRPKSHYSASGKLRNSAPSYPSKSDVDNYAKAVLDALNKTAWEDDSQIVELRVTKRYSDSGAQCGCFVIISEPAPELAG